MAKAGAPPDAVSFTRALYKESHGEFGVMTGFQDESPVAFAWITYPPTIDASRRTEMHDCVVSMD